MKCHAQMFIDMELGLWIPTRETESRVPRLKGTHPKLLEVTEIQEEERGERRGESQEERGGWRETRTHEEA